MRLNAPNRTPPEFTHEGALAAPHLTPLQRLRRSVLSCLLWEREFYEDGQSIADRIVALVPEVAPQSVVELAIEARHKMHLRHVPLLLLVALAKSESTKLRAAGPKATGQGWVEDALELVISRADELSEFLAIYWKLNPAPAGKRRAPIASAVKRGLARAFAKFDEYQLAKYNRDGAIKLRDVMFLTHPNPSKGAGKESPPERIETLRRLAAKTLATPDTWEVALSAGADKKATFERLIAEGNLGYLALLRNLRNMQQAGCDEAIVREAVLARKGAGRVLPFRYVAAARAVPQWEPWIDQALLDAISELEPLPGHTAVLVDVSGSMHDKLSAKSDLTRMDAAATLASIMPGAVRMFSFSNSLVEVPPRRGMAGVDAIIKSQPHGGTELFRAIAELNARVPSDRLIVITDEQATNGWAAGGPTRCPDPISRGYMINVASARNGVGYGKWTHIDGFSEAVLRYIAELERPCG